ncbi:MAG: site-2 protease family protein [Candidatus Aminicenantes bacterium]|nr:site-2 protease family protein [Candidatus Aminicenantes bacterium]NIM78909.1 site-2 protease family protein [Candidatus Aminicenantes bacterium]NIN18166.1 site-2 protease family protein [Candidatus Aminicenantes bacterium]NIN42065.1 site-2 protease family protein [Candidatus Aminicenantes bacterium]NIN85588.1 site-2 protease family protein [Candidatus Aminicenantes bacterium]
MNKIVEIIIQFGVVLFAISIHESSHAWMAYRFGDPTAKNQGRITLNPIAHIDPIGTIIFPLILAVIGAPVFGWAKPVMVNPYNLRNPRRANVFISAAGPLSNIFAALGGVIIFLILKNMGLFSSGEIWGIKLVIYIFFYLIVINIYLAIFNLIPVPPLDGSGILEGVLRGEALVYYEKIKPYGFLILLLIIYTGVLQIIAEPIILFVLRILA